MSYKTDRSILIDERDFFVGSNVYDSSTGVSLATENKITASDSAAGDIFGISVAVGNGRIVIGARNEGVGGAAYIFDLNGVEVTKITASDVASGDNFGYSVAVGNGIIVVGAYRDSNTNGTSAGAAYIFDLNGNELTKITASDGAANDNFGLSVAVGSGRIVVGAYRDSNTNGSEAGAAYIFDLNGNELTKITASDGAASDKFGSSIAVGSGRIVVGAYGDENTNGTNAGAAYIFDLNGNELTKITASDGAAEDNFGRAVAVGSGIVVVGAENNDSAYIFDLNGTELTKLTASDGAAGDRFGSSVAVGSGRIVVGAHLTATGNAYIFGLNGTELTKIIPSDGSTSDNFGRAVTISNGKIVIGAPLDDDFGTSSGTAYIFSTPNQTHFLDQID